MAMTLDGTNGVFLPTWTTATRPASPSNGEIGYNSTTGALDQYVNGAWASIPVGQTTVNASPYTTALGYQAATVNSSGTNITAIGYQSGASVTAGPNTFVGSASGGGVSSGTNNVAVGWRNLGYGGAGTTGGYNVCIGDQSLFSITTGSYNTTVGYQSGYGSTLANNVYIGYQAAYTGGNNDNVAIGYQALYTEGNTGNGQNVAIGSGASKVTTASAYNNVFVGFRAGYVATTSNGATCVGAQAGYNLTTGGAITCIGNSAGSGITTGSGGTYIGASVAASSSSAANELVVGVGNGPTGKGSNTAFINANGGGTYNGANSTSWATTSDRRLKKNIVDNTEGLDIINRIRIRNFEYRLPEEVTELPAHTVINKQGIQLGVIAQELQEVCPDCVHEESTGVISVDSDNIFWHMVNAIKDLKALIDAQAIEIAELKAART